MGGFPGTVRRDLCVQMSNAAEAYLPARKRLIQTSWALQSTSPEAQRSSAVLIQLRGSALACSTKVLACARKICATSADSSAVKYRCSRSCGARYSWLKYTRQCCAGTSPKLWQGLGHQRRRQRTAVRWEGRHQRLSGRPCPLLSLPVMMRPRR